MLPDYKNWMPMKLIKGLFLCTVVLFVLLLYIYNGTALAGSYRYAATGICAVLFLIAGAAFAGQSWLAAHFPTAGTGS